jgi:hypothetical protein
VVLILGKCGSGKSALGYRLLELLRGHGEPYAVGLSEKAAKLLPPWVGIMAELKDVPAKAVVLVDESYLRFHARGSMLSAGRTIGALINLSRQKQQTLIFSVQEARQLDVNIVSQIDVLAVKALSELSQGFERPQLRKLTDKARAAFGPLKGELRCWSWVYSDWRPALSHAFAQSSDALVQRRGQRPARKELKARAQSMHKAGLSYAQIGQNLGVSKTTAWRLLHGVQGSHID